MEAVAAKGLRPGMYRLTQDVKNPQADRRMKRDVTRQPVFKAGLTFRVWSRRNDGEDYGGPRYARTEVLVELLGGRYPQHIGTVFHYDAGEVMTGELVELLAPYMEEIPSTLMGVLAEKGYTAAAARDVLQYFVKYGVLTLDQIREVLEKANGEDEDAEG